MLSKNKKLKCKKKLNCWKKLKFKRKILFQTFFTNFEEKNVTNY